MHQVRILSLLLIATFVSAPHLRAAASEISSNVAQAKMAKQLTVKTKKRLTKDDLAHGERQVELMLSARPQMVPFVKPGDTVWRWTVRQFAGEKLGERIFWHSENPRLIFADHMGPYNDAPGYIRLLRDDKNGPVDGEKLWAAAVFELINIRQTPEFHAIHQQALAGRLTKAQYVRKNKLLEFHADQERQRFYHTVWLPHSADERLSSQSYYWDAGLPQQFDAWVRAFDRSYDAWDIYYNEDIANTLVRADYHRRQHASPNFAMHEPQQ